jgi:hypothetical protein
MFQINHKEIAKKSHNPVLNALNRRLYPNRKAVCLRTNLR